VQKNWRSSAPQASLPHDLEIARQVTRQVLLAVLVETPHIGHLAAMREDRAKRIAAEDLPDNATLTTVRELLVLFFAFCSSNPANGRLSEGFAQSFFLGFDFRTCRGAPATGKTSCRAPGTQRERSEYRKRAQAKAWLKPERLRFIQLAVNAPVEHVDDQPKAHPDCEADPGDRGQAEHEDQAHAGSENRDEHPRESGHE